VAENFCFRPQHKLGRNVGFSAVFANRLVLRGVLFDLHYRPNDAGFARLGIAIPKRNARSSVLRNRFKRLVREIFRHEREKLTGVDVVIRLVRSSIEPNTLKKNVTMRDDIHRLLTRLIAATVR
jgi:ribonuclease P protein component